MNQLNIHDDNNITPRSESGRRLTDMDREAFRKEMDTINALVEMFMNDDSDAGNSDAVSEMARDTTPETVGSGGSSLTQQFSYNDPSIAYRERLQRIGQLKQDPTGRNIKAAGEDL
jgi:hypothetical protein